MHMYYAATSWGDFGIAWDSEQLVATFLPGDDRLPPPSSADPPAWVLRLGADVAAHLRGDLRDFSGAPLALDGLPPFRRRVVVALRSIPVGSTQTYGELAQSLGNPKASRAVGQAVGRNPFPLVVPCHRVLAAGGAIGGFSAPGGTATKVRLLDLEGALP